MGRCSARPRSWRRNGSRADRSGPPPTVPYRRRRWPADVVVIGLAVVLLGLAGGAGAMYLTRHAPPASAAAQPPAPAASAPVAATAAAASGCVVSYRVRTEWQDGATVDVTIGNTGAMDLRNWALHFDLPSRPRVD